MHRLCSDLRRSGTEREVGHKSLDRRRPGCSFTSSTTTNSSHIRLTRLDIRQKRPEATLQSLIMGGWFVGVGIGSHSKDQIEIREAGEKLAAKTYGQEGARFYRHRKANIRCVLRSRSKNLFART